MAHALSDEEAGRQILGIFVRNKVQASGTLRRIRAPRTWPYPFNGFASIAGL